MPSLAWIDDDAGLRDSYLAQVQPHLPQDWKVVPSDPLDTVDAYHEWIYQNDVAVLLLDERLGDKSHVQYRGHDVVKTLRKRRPEFPVFMLTGYREDLSKQEGKMDGVVGKRDFQEDIEGYVERFVRAAMRYRESHQRDLNRMSELAAAVARGTATRAQKKDLASLQAYLVAVVPDDIARRSEVLDQLEERFRGLEELRKQLDSVLASAKKSDGSDEKGRK